MRAISTYEVRRSVRRSTLRLRFSTAGDQRTGIERTNERECRATLERPGKRGSARSRGKRVRT